jgi:4'-phosphopantetheinyl transferase
MLQRYHNIDAHEVHVWHLFAEQAANATPVMHALLSAEERERMARYRHESDRLLYLLSRGMMRTVLASYLGCAWDAVRYTSNAHGKPILDGASVAYASGSLLHFNLTHSNGAIALAVSLDREVGIDIESRHRPAEYLLLAQRFFTESEAQHLHGLDEQQRRDAFFAIWTLKEAFVKGIGRGLSFPLDAFCFELELDRLVAFKPLADFVSPDWHFQQFNLGEQHCGAIAIQSPGALPASIELREWTSAFLTSPSGA